MNALELASSAAGGGKNMLGVGGGIAILGAAIQFAKNVPQGQIGVRTRMGKGARIKDDGTEVPYGYAEPGWRFVIPGTHGLRLVDLLEQNNNFDLDVNSKKGEQLKVEASMGWAITRDGDGPYRSLYRTKEGEFTPTVMRICKTGLWKAVSRLERAAMEDHDYVAGRVHENCYDELDHYGVRLQRVSLVGPTETLGEMLRKSGVDTQTKLGSLAAEGAAEVGLQVAPGS